MSDTVYVYVIGREQGPVKVGISRNPYGRMYELQAGCPFKLHLLHQHAAKNRAHALRHEQMFHLINADLRLVGEWFRMDSDMAIDGIETGFEQEDWQARRGNAA